MADANDPVRLSASQRDQAAAMLTRAFLDDVMYTYVFPDRDQRLRSLGYLWRAVIKACQLYGAVYTTPAVSGAACWLAPGNTELSFWRSLRSGLPLAVIRFDSEGRRRLLELINYAEDIHKQLVTRPHWYLWALGVDPSCQGQGIGGRLLEPVLARADQGGVPCYLETQTEWNVTFYEKRGFEVLREEDVPGLRVWLMLREPG
jgi:GNAT superfamily N-acetyltransferase